MAEGTRIPAVRQSAAPLINNAGAPTRAEPQSAVSDVVERVKTPGERRSMQPRPAEPKMEVQLRVSPSRLESGQSADITWSAKIGSEDADGCIASSAEADAPWNGNKPAAGVSSSGVLTNTSDEPRIDEFFLTCTKGTREETKSVIVRVDPRIGHVDINWLPPMNNEDGVSVPDLAGYVVTYSTPGREAKTVNIENGGVTSLRLEGPPGPISISIVTVTRDGTVSAPQTLEGIIR